MDWTKRTARQDENHLNLGFGATYIKDFTVIIADFISCYSPPRAPQKIVNEHQLPTVASRLSVGQEIQVMVIEVMSPSEFWVQLMDEKAAPKYDQLQMDLNSDYSARVPNVSYR